MTKRDHRENTVGPWAEEKLTSLEEYLSYYCTYLKNSPFKTIYLDAFAGAPKAKIRNANNHEEQINWPEFDIGADAADDIQEFVLGSPHRALQLEQGFDYHYFFDLDERRIASLEELRLQYPNKHMSVRHGDANDIVQQFSNSIMGKKGYRGVAFLDPYGPQLHWQTVEALARTGTIEVLINFPAHMALNRLLCVAEQDRRPAWEEAVSTVMGDDSWKNVIYRETETLFGAGDRVKVPNAPEVLKELYRERLQGVFKCVSPPALIRNTKGSPLYYLFWAGPHPAGLKGASYVLGRKKKLSMKRRAGAHR